MRNHGLETEPVVASARPLSRTNNNFRRSIGQINPGVERHGQIINEKRKNALVKESEYGVQGIKASLVEATVRAEEIWGPALGGHNKEESLKSILSSLEKNRSIFHCGVAIEECIKRRDYQGLAEQYEKAQRYANDARSIADRAKQNQVQLQEADIHQIIMTARVWMEVESRVSEFKEDTWSRLGRTHYEASSRARINKSDEYLELIGILLQLGVQENPISSWLLARQEYLKSKIVSSFERMRAEVEILRRRIAGGQAPSAKTLATHIRHAAAIKRDGAHLTTDTAAVLSFWQKVHLSLESLLPAREGLLNEVFDFWDTAQSFIDGKKQRGLPVGFNGQGRKHHRLELETVKRLQTGVLNLFAVFAQQLDALMVQAPVEDVASLFSPIASTPVTPRSAGPIGGSQFNFDSSDVPPSPKFGHSWEKYAFWAPYSNSLSAGYFLNNIVGLIGTAAAEIASVNLVKEDPRLVLQLRTVVGDSRERCLTAICSAWVYDSENCKELEDWTRSTDKRDYTNLPAYFDAFESAMIANLRKVVYISEAANIPGAREVVVAPPVRHIEAVQRAFKHSFYKAFTGMMEHAAKPATIEDTSTDTTVAAVGEGITRSRDNAIDSSDIVSCALRMSARVTHTMQDVRKLLTLTNFQALRNEVVPKLISHFESDFGVNLAEDLKVARDVLAQMNARVFQAYVRTTTDQVRNIITAGITSASYASNTIRPSEAQPYVYEVLLALVLVHTEASKTAPLMTGQILSYLLEQTSLALIEAFKKRPRYSLPMLMQATLDVEFLAQTLNSYTTEKASEIQGQIYVALDERTDNEARQRLQNELPEMRAILKRLREKSKGEFACFRRARSGRDRAQTTGAAA